MAYSLPNFNLPVIIFTGPWLTKVVRSIVLGNLAYSRRSTTKVWGVEPAIGVDLVNGDMTLLLPPLTDIRAAGCYPVADVVEVPAYSGRWYAVGFVDDIGKGFANEHRAATLFQMGPSIDPINWAGSQWPTPMP